MSKKLQVPSAEPVNAPAGKGVGRLARSFVVLSITLVTLAVGVGLYMQLKLAFWVSLIAALALYVLLFTVHALAMRVRKVSALEREVAALRAEIDRGGLHASSSEGGAQPSEASIGAAPAPLSPLPTSRAPAEAASATDNLETGAPADRSLTRAVRGLWPRRKSAPASEPAVVLVDRDDAAVRRVEPHIMAVPVEAEPAAVSGLAPHGLERVPAQESHAASRDDDIERMTGLIKKMAQDVNLAEQARALDTAPARQAGRGVSPALQEASEVAIEESVRALRGTAEQLREMAEPVPARARPAATLVVPVSETAPSPVDLAVAPAEADIAPAPVAEVLDASPVNIPRARLGSPLLEALEEAVAAERVEVSLEPIMTLADNHVRHYEVTVRPQGPDGALLRLPEQVEEARGTGLVPAFDRVRLIRTLHLARVLASRGKTGNVFSRVAGESLSDGMFADTLAECLNQDASHARVLVLSLAQSDVRLLSPADWDTLAVLREQGFQFALASVTDFDMDFEDLRAAGFSYVKLDAAVFVEGMPASGGLLPAQDICNYLAGLGMTLIVGHVDDEMMLARILGFGALFGQGMMFGGPRVVRAQMASSAA